MSDSFDPTDPTGAKGWPAQDPSPGFAERVMAARGAELASARPDSRLRSRWGAARKAAAALVLLVLGTAAALSLRARQTGAAQSGSLVAGSRSEASLGARGTAVAEAGAALRWDVSATGEARVVQERGDVFYRVEHGGPFAVEAAGARIEVTGTCFRLELIPMRIDAKMVGSALTGAVVASAVLLTVYEGKVRFSAVGASAARTEVSAGEQARLEPGQKTPARLPSSTPATLLVAPTEPDAALPSTSQAVALREQQSRGQIAALQARVRQLELERAQLAQGTATEGPRALAPFDEEKPLADGRPPGSKFHDFTPAELKALAANCELRMGTPPLQREQWTLSPEKGAQLHLSDDEQVKVTQAVNALGKETVAKLRVLYIEATGDLAGADSLEPQTLGQEILHKVGREVVTAARTAIAREKAGLAPPSKGPASVAERYLRLMDGLGDTLQKSLEPLGAVQAGRLRDELTSWRSTMNGCRDEAR